MGSDAKEMKYRRRIGIDERARCSEQGGLDWSALKKNPVELLRKLDELRDHIARSCHIVEPPRESRRASRRALSMLPENLETLPLPGYHRAHYGGRYGHGLLPSPYEPLRPELREKYLRQSSGQYRQYPGRQWDNSGIGHGNYNHSVCSCPHCRHGERAAPQEEHIPMARYFAGQHEGYRFERSPSVTSSLYSHSSVSKKRAEYFRKKAEHLCRPVYGAAPFVVCSSCYQLLQIPTEKCMGMNHLQCRSCSEIISLKREEKVIPFSPSASFRVGKIEQGSNNHMKRDFEQQLNDFAISAFYNLNEHSSMQINIDFGDDNSVSSTISHDRIEKGCGSNRSIQLKTDGLSLSPSRSGDTGTPKDILCERDAECQVESSDARINPCSPILEDKLVDPLCSQENNDGKDLGRANRSDLNCKGELKITDDGDGSISMGNKQKGTECGEDSLEDESMCKTHEKKSNEDHCCSSEDFSKIHVLDSTKDDDIGSIEDGNERHKWKSKKDDTGSLKGENMSKEQEQKSKENENSGLEDENIDKGYDENNKENINDALEDATSPLGDTNSAFDVANLSERCEEIKMDGENGKSNKPFVEDGNALAESGSSVNERTDSGFSHGSSEIGLEEDHSSTGKSGDSSFFAGFLKKGLKDLSLFNQSIDNVKVSINGHPISERALKKAEKKAGPVEPGSYWYDYRAGFWGVMGRECIGIIPPFIREFNYPMASNCASGDTGVFVNGRELQQRDLDLLVGRGLPCISGKSYSVEISGNVTDEATGKKLRSLGKLAPTIEKLKRGFGMHVPEEFR
ncbi:hypothetical protein GUJ93_ZPchr0008g13277 [Zizania palustris]|uniref:Probable zinc-ribbon domain-containing protein n=1 Tax=Zizania palustris TaxID=103762 RepID=A0A8J5R945_ZIZPA|nr:hypothetical protein GUJ93_ZPchr0008g13277 [Zizania palustris]KAG8044878.1 hypothetical protein GUJ93_ZPchr0008g13277 [Zizania palustris]